MPASDECFPSLVLCRLEAAEDGVILLLPSIWYEHFCQQVGRPGG